MKEIKNIEDFLTHPEFIRWVKRPDNELDAYWNQWRNANPELLPSLRLAKEILLRTDFGHIEPPQGMKDDILQQVLRQREPHILYLPNPNPIRPSVSAGYAWYRFGQLGRVAAILVASLVLGWMLTPVVNDKMEPLLAEQKETVLQKQTAKGEKLQLTLADGTKVWLNSSSEVTFPEKFDDNYRRVSLVGEAYFEVVRDSLRPFVVETWNLETRVLGTSFNVNARNKERIAVALVSGKVDVISPQRSVSLHPGEMLDFDNTSASFEVAAFNYTQVVGWKDGILKFHRASLGEVKTALEEWYGVEIMLNNAAGIYWQFSGEYSEQTLEEVLESISYIKDFNYQIEDKTIRLTF